MINIISLAQVYPFLRTPYLTFDSITPFFYTLDKSNNNENLCSANLILLSQSSQNLPRRRISKIITWNPNLCFSCRKTQKKMHASRILRRSISHCMARKQNSLQPISVLLENSNPQKWLLQTRRTLILEPASSQFVSLHRLSDSDSGKLKLSIFQFQFRFFRSKMKNPD